MNTPLLSGSTLCVDASGVGRAIVDLFRQASLSVRLVPITITSGTAVTAAEGGYHVPKKDLVAALQSVLQCRRFHASMALPNGKILAQELATYRVKVSKTTGHESFEAWREHDHDDLVVAVAMPCWYGERPQHELRLY